MGNNNQYAVLHQFTCALINPGKQSMIYAADSSNLLVQGLGVGGGGRDVGVTGGLVGASGLLEVLGGQQVGVTSGGVLGGVRGEVSVHGGGENRKHG